MTLNEIAYNILNIVRGGRSNSDDNISLSQIKFNIKYYRAMMIRRDLARNNFMSRHMEQDLGCLKLVRVNASQCCNFDIECIVYRTEEKVPRTVRANFKDMITYVGGVDGINTIPVVKSDYIKYLPYDKYTKNHVRGVFEDPEEVAKFDCDGTDCYDDNMPFPMPADMVQAITTALLSGEMVMMANGTTDTTLDRTQDKPTG